MIEHSFTHPSQHDAERNAYNAAFHELGFRWHWDSDTYQQLARALTDAKERLRHYLENCQAHLLKAYDADFLVGIIEERQARHRSRDAAGDASQSRHFDWSQTLGAEIGA